MLIGIIGAPNKGKSTLFSALTMNDVAIADYPFTTIDPNSGIAYATHECAEMRLNVKCKARNSLCVNGTRRIPVNVIDVAGLVEGAHEGKGMGNQFLNDLAAADAFMLVVDASGRTDSAGGLAQHCSAVEDAEMILSELYQWLSGIITKHIQAMSKNKDGVSALEAVLTGLKIPRSSIERAIGKCSLTSSNISWSDGDALKFSKALLQEAKPVAIIANKIDVGGDATANVKALKDRFGEANVFECSAAIEMALRKASSAKVINYLPGSKSFEVIGSNVSAEQRKALDYMLSFLEGSDHGTGMQRALDSTVFNVLDNIVVYPVEDENKYTDHFGNVLPDAILLKKGSTALDLAVAIHTDLAKHMLYAVDAIRRMRIGKEQELHDGDVVKIVSAAK